MDDDEWLQDMEENGGEIEMRKSKRGKKELTADEMGREFAIKKACTCPTIARYECLR